MNWDDVGETLSDLFSGVLEFLVTAIQEFDAKKLGNAIGDLIANIDWLAIGEGLVKLLWEGVKLSLTAPFDIGTGIGESLGNKIVEAIWGSEELKKSQEGKKLQEEILEKTFFGPLREGLAGNWDSVKKTMNDTWGTVGRWFENNVFGPIKNTSSDSWNQIKKFSGDAWSGTKQNWNSAWSWIDKNVIDPIDDNFMYGWGQVKKAAGDAWDGTKRNWNNAWSWIGKNVVDPIKKNFSAGWNQVKTSASNAWTGVKNVWSNVKTWFTTKVGDPIKSVFSNAWDGIKNTWKNVKSWFENNVINPIKNTFSNMKLSFKMPHFSWTTTEAPDWIGKILSAIGLPKSIPLYPYNTHGFVGNGVSLDTELFSTNPVIALEFDFTGASQSEISGISILWDEIGGEAARDFQVKAYNGDTLLQTVTVTDNTDFWSFVEISLLEYSKITIEVQEWCLPQYHAKLSGVVMGRRVKFDKTNLINYEHSMSVDKCSLVLPENKISFTVDNSNGWFNPQNPEGIGKYVSEMQRFTVKYGFKIGNGVEWIPGGVFYLNDWSAPQNGITATFAGGDAFSLGVMGEKYTGALNNSLYNIAIAAISQANDILNEQVVIEADVSTELQGYNVNIPADEYECTIGETLQLIANALYRPLFQKRDGRLSIGFSVSGNNAVWSNQSITQNVAYQFGEYEVLKQIKRAIINDSGEYQVTGSTTGEVVNFDNIFVKYFTVSGLSVFYAAGLVNYLNGQKSVSGEYRPDPSTDCLDLSIIENKYSTANAMISELSFTYNGAFRGRYKGVIYSES